MAWKSKSNNMEIGILQHGNMIGMMVMVITHNKTGLEASVCYDSTGRNITWWLLNRDIMCRNITWFLNYHCKVTNMKWPFPNCDSISSSMAGWFQHYNSIWRNITWLFLHYHCKVSNIKWWSLNYDNMQYHIDQENQGLIYYDSVE